MIKCAHIRSKIFPRFSNSLQCRIYKTGTINFYTFICLSLLAAVQNETNSLINKSEIVLYKNKNEKLISSRKMEPKSPELISIRTGVKKPSDTDKAQISINEFLNFLKTAYQVQDSVEGILLEGGMNEAVNWLKSKELEFAQKGKNMSAQTSEAFLQQSANKTEEMLKKDDSFSNLNSNSEALKEKLNEVLSEGLLDSVLPYLVQNSQSLKKISSSCIISNKTADKTLNSLGATSISNEKIARKKSSGDASCSTGKSVVTKSESEVEIHVCDEMKNTKKTFVCNQKLLVEKMGYFAEVTLGQKLEDMDISVHCDIGIFEWLMQWVKKDDVLDEWPQLDSQCVIPILVSAAFLQMEPLLQDCLLYCHGHMNEILRSASNLSCLNDSVLTRLAAMYTNTEIESIKDRKDKIQSRLFTKMIQSLTEPDPESVRGHWCSLARIFRCEKCEQLLTPNVATKIPCIPTCMRLQPDGTIISLHFRDSTSWNINTYIRKLQKTLKTWRKVYWRLWGDVHFLYCVICKKYFSANRIGWCQYHPDSPQFFTLDAQKAALPIGRYPCCGERAYRFQLLQNQSGCQFRQHTVSVEDVRHSAIYAMLENYRDLIEEEPPELLFPERLTRLVARDSSVSEKFTCKESFWWDGFEIIPPRPKLGLLSVFSNRTSSEDSESLISEETSTEDDTISSTTSMESDEGSVESNPASKKEIIAQKCKNKPKNGKRLLWQHNLSARSNQDIQRAYEENILKEMSSMLTKKLLIEAGPRKMHKNLTTSGGIWLKLEADWRETVNQSKEIQLKSKNLTTNRANKPRSKF